MVENLFDKNLKQGGNMASEQDLKLQFLYKTIDRIDHYINLANLKASFLIAMLGIFLAIFFGNYRDITSILGEGCLKRVDDILFFTIIATALVAISFPLKVIFARLDSGETRGQYISIFYWASIRELSPEIYKSKFDDYEYEKIVDDVIRQIKVLSAIVHDKYRSVNHGVISIGIMLLQVLVLLILKLFAWS
jgi:hypothetical protein